MKRILLSCSFVIALIIPGWALAGPDRLSVLLGSEHINASREFQEINPGIILTWERQFNYSLGLYYNSYEEISPVVSVGYDWNFPRDLDIGAFFALAVYPGDGDEFSHAIGDVVPFVGLHARYKNVFVQFIPANGESLDALITFGLTFELD